MIIWDNWIGHTKKEVVRYLQANRVTYMRTGVAAFIASPVELLFAQVKFLFHLDYDSELREIKRRGQVLGTNQTLVDMRTQVIANSCLKISPQTIKGLYPRTLMKLAHFLCD